MDEMDDYYYRSKISLCPKYIELTTRLSDNSEMFYYINGNF